MPHDANGQEIRIGDTVRLTGRVTSVSSGSDTCNISVETGGKHPSTSCLNADAVELVAKTGETVQEAAKRGFDSAFKG